MSDELDCPCKWMEENGIQRHCHKCILNTCRMDELGCRFNELGFKYPYDVVRDSFSQDCAGKCKNFIAYGGKSYAERDIVYNEDDAYALAEEEYADDDYVKSLYFLMKKNMLKKRIDYFEEELQKCRMMLDDEL